MNWEFCQCGALRTLTTGSALGIQNVLKNGAIKINSVLTGSDGRSLLERSLPVSTGSECSKGGLGNIDPGVVLCFRRGLSEKNARLMVPQRRKNSTRTLATGSECSNME